MPVIDDVQQVSVIRVTRLSLTHFRNYTALTFTPAGGVTLLAGANGQGKTNLLESLHILATGRSHRAETDREVIGWSAAQEPIPYTRITADVATGNNESRRLEMVMQIARREELGGLHRPAPNASTERLPSFLRGGTLQKGYRVNGVLQRSTSPVGNLAVVLAGPEEVDLFAGPPSDRRRTIDSTALQTDRGYAQALRRYERLVTQRNAALRDARDRGIVKRTQEMQLWERELIRVGALLIHRRLLMLEILQDEMLSAHAAFTGHAANVNLDYRSTVATTRQERYTQETLETHFGDALNSAWRRDSATATTSVGPHRDDMRVILSDVDLGIYGSRGQQRTAALAFVIAQAAYIGRRLNDEPIILLDDPLSELDVERRERVLRHCLIPGRQLLITTANAELIPTDIRAHATMCTIREGTITPP